MNASSLSPTIARVLSCAAMAGITILSMNCGSKSPTPPSTTTTTAPATTTIPATTTTSSTTTTTVPGTTTTSTTTTSIAPLDAFISVQNTPCVAPNVGQVSCRFAGSAAGGRTPYAFRWTFTNPANNQVVTVNTQNASPELGCGFSSGVVTFSLQAVLRVTDANGTVETENRNQQIARQAGACGT